MQLKIRCQSCGMPLGEGYFGTNDDGTENHEYCKYCFERGEFVEKDLSLKEMVERSTKHMMDELGLREDEAKMLAETHIPKLKRWQKK